MLPLHHRDIGAHNMIRTRDLLITNQLLYQLSYVGNLVEMVGIEPTTFSLQSYCSPS